MSDEKQRQGRFPIDLFNGLAIVGAPWWARFVMLSLFTYGPLLLLVAIFLAMGAGWVPSPITETNAMVRTLHSSDAAQTKLLRSICRHTATTEMQVRSCDEDSTR